MSWRLPRPRLRPRLTRVVAAFAVAAALSVGGMVVAQAANGTPPSTAGTPTPSPTATPETGGLQTGPVNSNPLNNPEQCNSQNIETGGLGVQSLIPKPCLRGKSKAYIYEGFPATGYSSFYNSQTLDVTDWFFNDIASLLFMAVVWLGSVCVALLEWSFRLELVGDPTQPLNQANAITQVVGHLQTDIYLPFLTTAILVAGAWVLWNGLLRKRMTVTLQAAGWVVLAIGIASIFFAVPAYAVGALDGLATQVSTTILDAVGAAEQNLAGNQNIPECSDTATNQYCPLRQSINLYWSIYVYEPWAVAEFGDTNLANSANPKCNANGMTLGEQQLMANASGDSTQTASMANTVQDCITAVYGNGSQATSLSNWYQGKQGGSRFGIAFIAMITMLFASALLIGIAVAIILAQLGLILLSMVAPLFFLVAIHPSTGRQLFLRWAGLLLAFLMRRVLYAAFLAILLVLGSVILKGVVSESWFLGAVLQIALVILAFLYRKPFAQVFQQVGSPRLAAQLVGGSNQPVQRVRNWISQRVEPSGPDIPIPILNRQRMAGAIPGSGDNNAVVPRPQASASTTNDDGNQGRRLGAIAAASAMDGENPVGPQLDATTKLPPERGSRRRRLGRTAASGIAAAATNGATLGAGTVASEALLRGGRMTGRTGRSGQDAARAAQRKVAPREVEWPKPVQSSGPLSQDMVEERAMQRRRAMVLYQRQQELNSARREPEHRPVQPPPDSNRGPLRRLLFGRQPQPSQQVTIPTPPAQRNEE